MATSTAGTEAVVGVCRRELHVNNSSPRRFRWNLCLGAILDFGRGETEKERKSDGVEWGKYPSLPFPSSRLYEDLQLHRLRQKQRQTQQLWHKIHIPSSFENLVSSSLNSQSLFGSFPESPSGVDWERAEKRLGLQAQFRAARRSPVL